MDLIRRMSDLSALQGGFRIGALVPFMVISCLMLGCGRTIAIPPAKAGTPNQAMFPTVAVSIDSANVAVVDPILTLDEWASIEVKFTMLGQFALPLPTDKPPKVFPGTIMMRLVREGGHGKVCCDFETEFTGGGFTPSENSGSATVRVKFPRLYDGHYELRIESEPEVYPKANPPESVLMFSRTVRVIAGVR